MNEQELERLARQLGAEAAERLNVERTAQAVATRLREAPRRTVSAWVWMQPAWLRVAAALTLLLGAGLVTRGLLQPGGPRGPGGPAVPAVVPMGEDLSDLTAEQLRETARSLEQPLGEETGGAGAVDTGLEGLTADELRALLRTLEG